MNDLSKTHYLDVYPVNSPRGYYGYRLRANNGQILLYSGMEGYDKARALRAARNLSKKFKTPLPIRVLDSNQNVIRHTR